MYEDIYALEEHDKRYEAYQKDFEAWLFAFPRTWHECSIKKYTQDTTSRQQMKRHDTNPTGNAHLDHQHDKMVDRPPSNECKKSTAGRKDCRFQFVTVLASVSTFHKMSDRPILAKDKYFNTTSSFFGCPCNLLPYGTTGSSILSHLVGRRLRSSFIPIVEQSVSRSVSNLTSFLILTCVKLEIASFAPLAVPS